MKILESLINRRVFALLILIVALAASATRAQTTVQPTDGAAAQPTAFTYQGRLTDAGAQATGTFDFQFALFNQPTGGTALNTEDVANVTVTNGIFTVELDFGEAAFPDEERHLEIRVKRQGAAGYTTLTPRQKITSAPFAVRAKTATTANNALAVGGTTANQIIKEGDARLTDARTPLAGSLNYIQNTTTQQTNTDFNISGGGTLGGTLSANAVNSTTQFNIGGNRVLSIGGTENVFAGVNAGRVNTTGQNNAFFGENAGQANTIGSSNSFIGFNAGYSNTAGIENSFVGRNAGFSNSGGIRNSFFGLRAGFFNTAGSENSFFGRNAGGSNTTGSSNSFFGNGAGALNATGGNNTALGYNADFSADNLNYATAIGSGAVVSTSNTIVLGRTADTVRIPGNLNLTGTFTGNIPAGSIAGTLSAANIPNLDASKITSGTFDAAQIPNLGASYIQNSIDQQTGNFNISGNGTLSGTLSGSVVNAATQYNIGGERVLATPLFNIFLGKGAGAVNTGNNRNTFVGNVAGNRNTTGADNSFFGSAAGFENTTGVNNAFFGANAGQFNTAGSDNSFFGRYAGFNGNGSGNSFFGTAAGENSGGSNNSFFGVGAGRTTGGINNVFVGVNAASQNTSGNGNTVVGANSGTNNITGSNITLLGSNVNLSASNLNYATAIGAGATVSSNNTVSIGRFSDTVQINGPLGVNVSGGSSTSALCISGTQIVVLCSSSLRYKQNVASFDSGLDLIKRLRPISYEWKDGGADVGFGAEDVAKINQLFTVFGKDGQVEGVKYDRFSVLFVNAFKEQQAQIEAQARQINELKQIVCALRPDAAVCK